MKNVRVAALLLAAVAVPQLCLGGVGRTPGTFSVSSSGAATYTIPLRVPPGPRGLQPSLALLYNHQSGPGFVGVGWNLVGLSAISRCARTYAQDAAPAAISLTYADAFCLDGRRLRLTSSENLSTYGQAGTTYQTEIAEFSNVTAHDTAGQGPAYFVVQGKDGNTYEYGNPANSSNAQVLANGTSTVLSWMLDKVTDRAGNTMVIAYTAPGSTLTGTTVPASISWTPIIASASTYTYQMVFAYTNNVPASSLIGYVGGTSVVNEDLLLNVTITNLTTSTTIKQYVLNYETSATTGAYRLNRVTECADTGQSNCLSPTNITYQNGAAGISTTGSSVSTGGYVGARYDFNGDGYPDLAYYSGTSLIVRFGSASGYGAPVITGVSGGALFGDLLGSGQDGILAGNASNGGATWWYYSWNTSSNSFVATLNTTIPIDSGAGLALMDVNGDGLPDLVSLYWSNFTISSGSEQIYTRLNTGGGSTVSFGARTLAWSGSGAYAAYYTSGTNLRSLDFDGDGRADLAVSLANCTQPGGSGTSTVCISNVYALLGQANGTFSQVTSPIFGGQVSGQGQTIPMAFGNFNGDGCTDFVGFANQVIFNSCSGGGGALVNAGGSQSVVAVMDWDGDGRSDLITTDGSQLYYQLSTGTGFGAPTAISGVTYSASCAWVVLDANGDGLDDLGCSTSSTFTYYLHNLTKPDLVASITDGYGNSASPTYTSMVQGGYTATNDATYPYKNYIAAWPLVTSVQLSDPSNPPNGTYSQTFTYQGAAMSLLGRGFVGFEQVQSHDSRNGLYNTRVYARVFPNTGMPLLQITSQDSAHTVLIADTENTPATSPISLDATVNNQRVFPYIATSTAKTYEVQMGGQWGSGGPKNGQLIRTSSTTYTFDNYGNATTVATTLTDNDAYSQSQWTTTTNTQISPNTTNWCLTQPTLIAVTRTAPGANAVTRTVGFTPDYPNCRQSQAVVEPSSPSYALTQVFTYDPFGNVSKVAVSGAGFSGTRNTLTGWGTTGQFPVSRTNALNQGTSSTYDPNFGVQTSATDLNNVSTSWQYDAFGRKTRENRPDGTYTIWTYNDCTALGACLLGAHTLAVTQTVYNHDGSMQTDSSSYFDELERGVLTNKRLLGGTYDRNEIRYDALGNVIKQAMPCAWASVTTPCTNWQTISYDMVSRPYQIQGPISGSNPSTIAYEGDTVVTTDPLGNVSTKISTAAGTLGRSQDYNGYYQNFSYDGFGSLLSVTDQLGNPLFSASYAYGVSAFQTDATDMDLDVTAGPHRQYTFDALGEILSYTDAKGQNFSFLYDVLSRLTSRVEKLPSGTIDLTTTWTWDTATNGVGKLQSVTANSYAETYSYDTLGRVANRSITIPSDGQSPYAYDLSYNSNTGFLDTLTYPASTASYRLKLQYGYQNGILQGISDANAPNTVFWAANAADVWGHITQETLGNGVVTNRAFDPVTGWVSSLHSGLPLTPVALQNESYLYDQVGNVTERQSNNVGLTEDFFYDNLYRLDHSTLNGTVNLQMAYDAMGNITSKSDVANGTTWAYGDATRKHAVTQAGNSSLAYAYDSNGNMTSRNGSTIQWTSFNHPSQINGAGESVLFSYNQDHLRWSSIYTGPGGTETTYFIGGLLEKVVTSGVDDFRHYIFAGGTQVAIYSRQTTGANTLRYIREDRQGSVAGIINNDSNATSDVKESFTPFGLRRNCCTWTGLPTSGMQSRINAVTRHGYTWQTALGNMGLNDMNGRVQDAVTGRFLSADPYIPNPTNTQSYNRYSYVMNNPLTFIDPSGFADKVICVHEQGTSSSNQASANSDVPISGTIVISAGQGNNCYTVPDLQTPWFLPPGTPNTGGTPGNPGAPSQIPLIYPAEQPLEEVTITGTKLCPSAPPLSKNDMTPVPFTDDNGNSILGSDGTPMQRPASMDPHAYTAAGAADLARTGPGVFQVNSLLNFRIGGPWDAQRGANGMWYPEFRNYANVALGLYAGADGLGSDKMNWIANFYAGQNSNFTGQVMDAKFTNLPQVNVDNTALGASLATAGGGWGVCTPNRR